MAISVKVQNQVIKEKYAIYNGDSCEILQGIPDDSIHYSITSIPFASLYTYSNSERDLGNSRTYSEFWNHYEFLIRQWVRVMMPGRLISIHCMNLPSSKERDGVIGLRDFRGDVIRGMLQAGMIYHSEVVIWKDPVVAMQRTKALGLLHKQIKKDSCMSRQGIPDYLVTFRKPGDNPERTTHTSESFPVDRWQRYASPIWTDIRPGDTLQKASAREDKDEKHICPLQLSVIRRGIELWTNPNDIVLDPFDGIGSTGYCAIEMGRRHIGIELKRSYYEQAITNCFEIANRPEQMTIDM
jgi:DNA modification methylase